MSCCPPDGFDEDEDRDHVDRPVHSRKFAQFSDEWYRACNQAFAKAWRTEQMRQNHPSQTGTPINSFIENTLLLHGSKQIEAS